MMMEFLGKYRRFSLVIVDAFAVNLAVVLSLVLRFDGAIPRAYIDQYFKVAPFYTVLTLAVLAGAGLYSWIWRYASIDALVASAFGATGQGLIFYILTRHWVNRSFPRSIPVVAGVLGFIFIGGIRILVRLGARFGQRLDRRRKDWEEHRVLVVGAGDAGAVIGRELSKPGAHGLKIAGYVDDDPAKKGALIHGARVLGSRASIASLVKRLNVHEIMIAMPSAPSEIIRDTVEKCQGLGVKIRALPRISDLAAKNFDLSMVRQVEIEDLLGRPEVGLETAKIEEYITGKTVLVTGGGGSIGSEICRQVADYHPARLVILGHGENSIFAAKMGISRQYPDLDVEPVIADVRDCIRMRDVFAAHRPDVVFHAAAHKHVPLMEVNLTEAIKTNIFGTLNVARASRDHKVETFVMISTDKAVNPVSVMGVSKRVAEMIVSSMSLEEGKTTFVSVRFGNVLGSSGSVVPIFKRQIARGGPVTVTHPKMKRYFMTIKEAVQLVLQAGTMGQGGEVFVLDMGEPVHIVNLAEQMIRLSGRVPYSEIPIVFTGVRPGEKLFEDLFMADEGTVKTAHSKIFVARGNNLSSKNGFLGKMRRLEEAIFPYGYPVRLFPEIEAGQEALKGIMETAATSVPVPPILPGNPTSASSREQEVLRILRELVPSYDPLGGKGPGEGGETKTG